MLETAAALTPLVAVVVAMTVFAWPAARAGVLGAVLAWLVAVSAFDLAAATGVGTAAATGGVVAEVVSTTAGILWIVAPALCIYRLQVASGAAATLRDALAQLSPDPRIAALLVAWFFTLLLEGAAGFGTSAALAAPFLVAMGFPPVQAVTAALVGNIAGVSFGAVGTPVAVQVAAGLPATPLAQMTALYHVVCGGILVLVLARLIGRAVPGGGRLWPWAVLAGVAFYLPFAVSASVVGPELPTLAGALLGGGAFAAVVAVSERGAERPAAAVGGVQVGASPDGAPPDGAPPDGVPGATALLRAAAPYLLLVGAVLVTRLVPPVTAVTTGITIGWSWHGFAFDLAPLHHPGSLLALSFVGGAALQRVSPRVALEAVRHALGGLGGVTVALLGMLALSRLLVHADMVETLARSAATATGAAWPLLAPAVGAVGSFVTGSATASNILLTDLQQATAAELGAPAVALVAAQGFGAAVGNAIAPHNVVAAGATVSLHGAEGEVLRHTVPTATLCAVAGGVLAVVLVAGG